MISDGTMSYWDDHHVTFWCSWNFLLAQIFLVNILETGHLKHQDGHVLSLLDVDPTGITEFFKLTWSVTLGRLAG